MQDQLMAKTAYGLHLCAIVNERVLELGNDFDILRFYREQEIHLQVSVQTCVWSCAQTCAQACVRACAGHVLHTVGKLSADTVISSTGASIPAR